LWLGAAVAFIAAATPLGPSFAQVDLSEPIFVGTPCSLSNVTPETLPRLRCGTVSVPRNHENPGGGRFKLAVVVVGSVQQPPLPDPVVYINGGPGSPLTILADRQDRTPYAPNRDLILVDQRGTGRSEPKLCPHLDGALLDSAAEVAATNPSDDALAKRRAVCAACRAEATEHGFDLKDFGTSVTGADFEWVRRALRIERWNVYGESYGTTVAMTLVARHPRYGALCGARFNLSRWCCSGGKQPAASAAR
jgi:pimeloyl-ACP methyl ester carboxylesterase